MKILLIRLSSMGDIILTSAFVRILKTQIPECEIHFLVVGKFSEIFKYNPYINKVIEYDKSNTFSQNLKFKKLLKENELNNSKYDLIIDLQKNLRSRVFRFNMGKRVFSIKKNRLHKLSLVHCKKPLIKTVPVAEIYYNSIRKLNLPDDKLGLELWLEKDRTAGKYIPHNRINTTDRLNIALAPGATHFTKRWLPDYYIELIELINKEYKCAITLIGGKDDKPLCDYIQDNLVFDIKNESGSQSIQKTAEIIAQQNLLVTNDTGVMHIAAARQVPVIAIFGSTVTNFGFSPYRCKNIVVERSIPCRPCTHIGRAECPKKHFKCMKEISPKDVFGNVEEMLKK